MAPREPVVRFACSMLFLADSFSSFNPRQFSVYRANTKLRVARRGFAAIALIYSGAPEVWAGGRPGNLNKEIHKLNTINFAMGSDDHIAMISESKTAGDEYDSFWFPRFRGTITTSIRNERVRIGHSSFQACKRQFQGSRLG